MSVFGDLIPGHGGIMDRFDCQFLMATFVNVYYASFIRWVMVKLENLVELKNDSIPLYPQWMFHGAC